MPNNHLPVFKISPSVAVKILFYANCKNSFNTVRSCWWVLPEIRLLATGRAGVEAQINDLLCPVGHSRRIKVPVNAACAEVSIVCDFYRFGQLATFRINIFKCRKSSIGICDQQSTLSLNLAHRTKQAIQPFSP